MSTQSFINSVAPGAQTAMVSLGVLASLTIAQAILESGWGAHAPGNNLFGIKANGWTGKTQLLKTNEVVGGKTITIMDVFRAYPNWAASIEDHANFIVTNPRYKNIIGDSNYKTACSLVRADGYSTSQNYSQELIGLIEDYKLTSYDKLPAQMIVDSVNCAGGAVTVSGWALNMAGVAHVDLYYDKNHGVTSTKAFTDRPDVKKACNSFGWYPNGANCGFKLSVPAGKIPAGKHTLNIPAVGSDGSVQWKNINITVV